MSPGAFDANKPFTTRDGREVTAFRQVRNVFGSLNHLRGKVDGDFYAWLSDGKSGVSGSHDLDLVNVPDAPVPPAGGGEDKRWPSGKLRDCVPLVLTYTNWRGETSIRRIVPLRVPYLGSTEWHRKPTWLLPAWDLDKQAEREFDMSGFAKPDAPTPAPQATRDEVIEECTRIADRLDVESTSVRSPYLHGSEVGSQYAAQSIAKAIRALKQEPASDGWRPIDSAPRDGTHVLVAGLWPSEAGWVCEAWFSDADDNDGWYQANTYPIDAVNGLVYSTHWRPLPDPPQRPQAGTAGVMAPVEKAAIAFLLAFVGITALILLAAWVFP